jgi:outer membrane receptor protein involved in Fe transport
MKSFLNKATMSLAVAAAVGAMTSTASAQVLEEVVVTATKRAESLQDVSISMLAVDGESIREAAITKMEDLTNSLPAVTVVPNPIGNFIFIRGIGSSTNQGIEQSVSMFHDGIYMGRHQLSRAPFMDLERVEVLRGPQSILFGKNTIGGAMSIITAKPTEEFEGLVS